MVGDTRGPASQFPADGSVAMTFCWVIGLSYPHGQRVGFPANLRHVGQARAPKNEKSRQFPSGSIALPT
jgi:hypothetical protein